MLKTVPATCGTFGVLFADRKSGGSRNRPSHGRLAVYFDNLGLDAFGFRFGPLQRRELEDPYVDTALVCVLGPDGELVALNLFG